MTVWYKSITILKQYYALQTAGLITLCAVIITTLFLSSAAFASPGVNQTLSFQGRLLTGSGSVVPDGYYNMQFKIYQDGTGTTAGDTGGTLKWTENYVNNNADGGVQVKDGFFSVPLGSVNPFGTSVDWNQDTLFLSMNVAGSAASCTAFGGGTCAADGEMLPMKRITSAPYALNSGQLGGKTADNFVQLGQGVQTDASSNTSSIFVNKTGYGNLIQLQNAGSDLFTVTNSGDITLGGNSDHVISIDDSATNTTGGILQLLGGRGGSGGTGADGGALVLQGGDAGGANGDGGNVSIDAGEKAGTGTDGYIGIGTTRATNIVVGSTYLNTQQYIYVGANDTAGNYTSVTVGNGGDSSGGSTTIQAKDSVTIKTNGTTRATFSDTTNTTYFGNGVTASAPSDSTIQGTNSSATTVAGGSLTVQGGDATVGDASGGNVTISGGAGSGSGTSGSVVVKANGSDSTTAFQVQDASGSSVLSIDTANKQIGLSGTTTINSVSLPPSGPTVVGVNIDPPQTSGSSRTVSTVSGTQTGDLVIITAYVEPANNGTSSAAYANFTPPSGFAVLPLRGFPIVTDDTAMTTRNTHRLYEFYYYATADGSQNLTFTGTDGGWIGLSATTIRGGPTSGDPLADNPAGATISSNATNVTSSPPVTLNLGGEDSLVLWTYGGLGGYDFGAPAGYSNMTNSAAAGEPTIAYHNYASAGSTGAISAPRVDNNGGMSAALLSFRKPGGDSSTALSVKNYHGNQTFSVDANGNVMIQSASNSTSAFQLQDANGKSILNVDTVSGTVAIDKLQTANIDTDSATSLTLGGTNATNVAIGNGIADSHTTLLTLDQSDSAPGTAALGSMYYNSTIGKVQCYQDNGWGACGNSPDSFVSLSPQYSNAVMNGAGSGTITSDLCSDSLNINDGSPGQANVCGTNETYNFYGWTSTQTSAQTRSIYITYQLPSTFKNFVAGSTSLMGRTNSSDATTAYHIYKSHGGSALSACGASMTASTGAQTSWQKKSPTGVDDPSNCDFVAGDSVLIRIDLTSSNNAFAYVSNLNFAYSNQ